MDAGIARSGRSGGWIEKVGAVGAVLIPLALVYSFFTSGDTGDTGAEVIAYANDNQAEAWTLQIIALVTPVLIGLLVASLWARLRAASEAFRALTLIGGTLFIAFFSTGMTLWAIPLLSPDELTEAGADAYLTFDDMGWVLLALSGISIGLMIIGVSLAALEQRWLPAWAGWLSLALGVVSFATMAAIGIFAWVIWLFAAGIFLLLRGERLDAARPAMAEHV